MVDERQLDKGLRQLREGNFDAAVAIYQGILAQEPNNHKALHYLGLACYQMGKLQDAQEYLARSLNIEPQCASTWNDIGIVAAKSGDYNQSVTLFKRALHLNENHSDALNNLAAALEKLHRPRDALPLLDRLVRLLPKNVNGLCRLADTQYKLGHVEDSISNYQKAIRLEPSHKKARVGLGEAYESAGKSKQARLQYYAVLRRDSDSPLALAKLLQFRDGELDKKWVERAHVLALDATTAEEARISLNIALGYYYDRAEHYDQAFDHFRLAYDQQFAKQPFDSTDFTTAVDRLIEVFSTDFFSSARTHQIPTDRPIFIVGMPRSGTTLVEQILASHSQVAAGGELSTMIKIGYSLQDVSFNSRPYPDGVLQLGKIGMTRLTRTYLDSLREISACSPRVTDKLPFNFVYVGLIALLLPQAKIIHCHRHPLDNCLSCYFTNFNEEIQFANNLTTLGRYYRDYSRLMDHWHAVIPVKIHDVEYERLVADPETSIRNLVEQCGLDWEDSCLRFHEVARNIQTPSRWQVRRPIYSRSVNRWTHYDKHIGPLKDVLAPLLN